LRHPPTITQRTPVARRINAGSRAGSRWACPGPAEPAAALSHRDDIIAQKRERPDHIARDATPFKSISPIPAFR
jgi:hypothetical protein